MNLTLWIVAGLLATVFAAGGVAKLVIPKEQLATFPGGGGSTTSAPVPSRRSGSSTSSPPSGWSSPPHSASHRSWSRWLRSARCP